MPSTSNNSKPTIITYLQTIFKTISQHYGNPLHICVYIRDLQLFNFYKTQEYINEKFNGYKPLELAAKLGYFEFFNAQYACNEVITGEIVIKQGVIKKYINLMRGYRSRLVKLTLNYLITCSEKCTVYELDNACIKKEGNKICIQVNRKKIKLKLNENENENVNEWYELLINKEKRRFMVKDGKRDENNTSIYIFLIKILVDKCNDEELKNLVMGIEPFSKYFNVMDSNRKEEEREETEREGVESVSVETDYDSCNEEFYDVESK